MYFFDKTRRLLNKSDFDYVFAQSEKIVTSTFILLHRKNSLEHARIGFALSKKIIAKACQRNRIKRLLRESFRTHTLPAVDIIILARHGVAKVDNKLITVNIGNAWDKLTAFYVN